MDGRTRREGILRLLAGSDACLSASKLAERFGVTRQVIVSDIALLRANGQKILATRLGYRLERAPEQGKLASVVCRHGDRQVVDEFCAVVDNGGAGLNVIVEHPLYGEGRMMKCVAEIQAAIPEVPVIGSAYSYLRQFSPNLAAGMIAGGHAAMAGFGRMAFAYPDSPTTCSRRARWIPRRCA